jgi:protein ImuA
LAHLARQAAGQLAGHIVWVGPQSRPNPQFLERLGVLDRSLFVDAVDAGRRLWAIELSMRCPAVACVAGDAQGFNISATRRLELAARDCNCLALLARPACETGIVSAALTRWAVHPLLQEREKIMGETPMPQPAWMLELLRCKGMQPAGGNQWPLEWDCAKGAVIISAAILKRLSQAAPAQGQPRRTTSAG